MRLSNKNKIFVVHNAPAVTCVCPVCEYVAKDEIDLKSIQKESACSECTLNFKYLDLELWKKGHRPTREKARSKITKYVGEINNE
jgi:hypothetical protein